MSPRSHPAPPAPVRATICSVGVTKWSAAEADVERELRVQKSRSTPGRRLSLAPRQAVPRCTSGGCGWRIGPSRTPPPAARSTSLLFGTAEVVVADMESPRAERRQQARPRSPPALPGTWTASTPVPGRLLATASAGGARTQPGKTREPIRALRLARVSGSGLLEVGATELPGAQYSPAWDEWTSSSKLR